jgi:hypothetical protein
VHRGAALRAAPSAAGGRLLLPRRQFPGGLLLCPVGDAIDELPNDLNDEISSIRMLGGDVEVTIFQNREFKGKSKRFDEDVRSCAA